MIDKKKLNNWFADVEANKQDITLALWDISKRVAKAINGNGGYVEGETGEDLANAILLKLLKTIPKYRRKRKSAFSYFYFVGMRYGFYLVRRSISQQQATDALVADGGKIPISKKNRRITPDTVESIHSLLDRTIMKLAAEIEGLDTDSEQYRFGIAGVIFLQQFRYLLRKKYRLLTLPTYRWETDKAIAIAKD